MTSKVDTMPVGGLFIYRWMGGPKETAPMRAVFEKVNTHDCRCIFSALDGEPSGPYALAHYRQNDAGIELVDPSLVEGFRMACRMDHRDAALRLIGLEPVYASIET